MIIAPLLLLTLDQHRLKDATLTKLLKKAGFESQIAKELYGRFDRLIASITNQSCSITLIIKLTEYLCAMFVIKGHSTAVSIHFRALHAKA